MATKTELDASTLEGATRTRAAFKVKVTPAEASGSVSLMNGDASIGAAVLDADGTASLTVDALPEGVQKITAIYQGDAGHSASSSAAAEVNSSTSGVPGFTLTANPATLSVPVGKVASTIISVNPENGFNQAVSLSCSGLPYASATCTFTPAAVTPGAKGAPAVSTLDIQTQTASGTAINRLDRTGVAYAIVLPGILALAGLGMLRKRAFGALRLLGVATLMVACGVGLSSCAARYNYFHRPPAGNPGTPLGNYAVVISGLTGTGSSLSTSKVNITLSVTK